MGVTLRFTDTVSSFYICHAVTSSDQTLLNYRSSGPNIPRSLSELVAAQHCVAVGLCSPLGCCCRCPLGLTPVHQDGAPNNASRTIAVAIYTSCSTQNACEFVLVSRAQSHHANTLVGLLALTRFFTSVRFPSPGLGSHGRQGTHGLPARLDTQVGTDRPPTRSS